MELESPLTRVRGTQSLCGIKLLTRFVGTREVSTRVLVTQAFPLIINLHFFDLNKINYIITKGKNMLKYDKDNISKYTKILNLLIYYMRDKLNFLIIIKGGKWIYNERIWKNCRIRIYK